MRLTKTRAVALLCAALLWVISPWDGDFLPVVGWIDDMLIMALALYTMYRSYNPASASPDAPLDAWKVLGLAPGASPADIKRAYREQMALYHPDKTMHLGPELQEAARKKTLEIKRAYDRLLG